MEYLVLVVLVAGFALVYFKKESVTEDTLEEDRNRILELEKSLVTKETEAKQQQQNIDIANAKTNAFEALHGIYESARRYTSYRLYSYSNPLYSLRLQPLQPSTQH